MTYTSPLKQVLTAFLGSSMPLVGTGDQQETGRARGGDLICHTAPVLQKPQQHKS